MIEVNDILGNVKSPVIMFEPTDKSMTTYYFGDFIDTGQPKPFSLTILQFLKYYTLNPVNQILTLHLKSYND